MIKTFFFLAVLALAVGVSRAAVAVQNPHCPCDCKLSAWTALNATLTAAINVQENRLRNMLYSATFSITTTAVANTTVGLQAPLLLTFTWVRVDDFAYVMVRALNGSAAVAANAGFLEFAFVFPTLTGVNAVKCDNCFNIATAAGAPGNVTYLDGHVGITGTAAGTVLARPVYLPATGKLRLLLPIAPSSGTNPAFQLGGNVSSNNIGLNISILTSWITFRTDKPFSVVG